MGLFQSGLEKILQKVHAGFRSQNSVRFFNIRGKETFDIVIERILITFFAQFDSLISITLKAPSISNF